MFGSNGLEREWVHILYAGAIKALLSACRH